MNKKTRQKYLALNQQIVNLLAKDDEVYDKIDILLHQRDILWKKFSWLEKCYLLLITPSMQDPSGVNEI